MLDINNLVQWQKIDPNSGIVFPWWTDGAIDRIKGWSYGEIDELASKTVLEFGGGWSTIWFAKHAAHVYCIEANRDWARAIVETLAAYNLSHKCTILLREINEGDQSRAPEYTQLPPQCDPDIICIDGILRHNCLELALALSDIRPRLVIFDNWEQSGINMSPASVSLVRPFRSDIFTQENHTDNDGVNKWKTAFFYLDSSFLISSDFDSHRPLLLRALEATTGPVIELGCGYGSTSSLARYCREHDRVFLSFENNIEWAERFGSIFLDDYTRYISPSESLVFIDCAPAEIRKELISLHAHATAIVVHDTEPSAEYVYHMSDVLGIFKYRTDFAPPGLPSSTFVSNTINI